MNKKAMFAEQVINGKNATTTENKQTKKQNNPTNSIQFYLDSTK